jgi:predicted 3-demethylubiquinone-9 3-methyltransferase (glyoxalase superfamily)
MTSKPFTTFLWFDTRSEEAARYSAMLTMTKFDVAALERAYAGTAQTSP